jgi:hypothetical protein
MLDSKPSRDPPDSPTRSDVRVCDAICLDASFVTSNLAFLVALHTIPPLPSCGPATVGFLTLAPRLLKSGAAPAAAVIVIIIARYIGLLNVGPLV